MVKRSWGMMMALLLAFAPAAYAQEEAAAEAPAATEATTEAGATAPTDEAQAAAEPAPAAGGTGTLRLEIKPFTSEIKLKKKVEEQLRSGGIEWGIEGDLMVVTMVNKRFVDFDVAHMTRYGSTETLELPAGEYRLTGIGLEMVTGFNVNKILDKGAFLNEDILRFTIVPGQETVVSINPVIRSDMTFLIKWYVPALMTTINPGTEGAGEVAINLRNEASLPWRDYNGPLKFKTN